MSYSQTLLDAKRDVKWRMRDKGHWPTRFEIVAPRLRGSSCQDCDAIAWLAIDRFGTPEVSGSAVRERCPYKGPETSK